MKSIHNIRQYSQHLTEKRIGIYLLVTGKVTCNMLILKKEKESKRDEKYYKVKFHISLQVTKVDLNDNKKHHFKTTLYLK